SCARWQSARWGRCRPAKRRNAAGITSARAEASAPGNAWWHRCRKATRSGAPLGLVGDRAAEGRGEVGARRPAADERAGGGGAAADRGAAAGQEPGQESRPQDAGAAREPEADRREEEAARGVALFARAQDPSRGHSGAHLEVRATLGPRN